MLALSKVYSQKLCLSSTDKNELIKETFSSISGNAKINKVVFTQKATIPNLVVDKLKIKRVFQNLLYNAIKFYDPSKDERFVHISYKIENGHHLFIIEDHGKGIAETKENIFDPFTYLNAKDEYKGTGMGLAMCQKIVEKHGDEIWYESELGKGSKFYFTMKN